MSRLSPLLDRQPVDQPVPCPLHRPICPSVSLLPLLENCHPACQLVPLPLHHVTCPQLSQAPLLIESETACLLVPGLLHQPVCCQLGCPLPLLEYEPRCQPAQDCRHHLLWRKVSRRPSLLIGTLRSKDGDGRENVVEKVNSRSFNLHRDYSKSLTLSNVGEPS